MRGRLGRWWATAGVALVVAGCGGREVTLPDAADVPAPTFATLPDDLATSPQLDAVPVRDTAGLTPDELPVQTELLAPALAWAATLDPRPTRFNRISIYDDDVYLTWLDPANPKRSISGVFYGDGDASVSDPTFDEEPGFTLEGVDPTVPTRLRDALARRFPDLVLSSADLRVGTSYGFGLVWNLELSDARGTLAAVYADLDGAIVAVDPW